MGVGGGWAVEVLCKILWVKLIEGGYRNEWQFLRGNSVRPAKCQGNAVGRNLSGIYGLGQPRTGELVLPVQLLAYDLSPHPTLSRSDG